ncbi:kinase-like domain-containing protein [Chlamydoabsidia padenii]|nr:kinase-like domain-containing protein [Chlamydoabsidia padenii]
MTKQYLTTDHVLPLQLVDRYDMGHYLGRGGYGFVLSAVDRVTHRPCAIKFIYKVPDTSMEISLLGQLHHDHIIHMITWCQDDRYIYLVMETHGMDLFACLEQYEYFSEQKARHVFRQVLEAIKLIDFGSAIRYQGKMTRFHGTLSFASPEILKGLAYEPEPAEVWSLGVLLYTLLYGQAPFSSTLQAIHGYSHSTTIHTSKAGRQLLALMFRKNPKNRPTLEQIYKHPWMTDKV